MGVASQNQGARTMYKVKEYDSVNLNIWEATYETLEGAQSAVEMKYGDVTWHDAWVGMDKSGAWSSGETFDKVKYLIDISKV